MSIIIENSKRDFEPAPEGVFQAVCCDVTDMGMQEGKFGVKRKVEVAWQINELMENGKPFIIAKWFTASLHKKSTLRPVVDSHLPQAIKEDESFDLEQLIGKNVMLEVHHEQDAEGEIRARVKNVMRMPKGTPPMKVTPEYKRRIERPDWKPPEGSRMPKGPPPGEEQDIPF